jgi:hypothetical protein
MECGTCCWWLLEPTLCAERGCAWLVPLPAGPVRCRCRQARPLNSHPHCGPAEPHSETPPRPYYAGTAPRPVPCGSAFRARGVVHLTDVVVASAGHRGPRMARHCLHPGDHPVHLVAARARCRGDGKERNVHGYHGHGGHRCGRLCERLRRRRGVRRPSRAQVCARVLGQRGGRTRVNCTSNYTEALHCVRAHPNAPATVLTPTHPRPRRPRRYWLIPTLIAPSAVFGVWYAYSVIMDRLPELVGLFNSFGGLAAALEGIAVYTDRTSNRSMYSGAGLSDTEQKIQLVVLFLRCSSPTLSTCLCVACCLPVVVAGTNRLIVVAGCAPSQHHRRYDDFHGLHRRCTKADCRVET